MVGDIYISTVARFVVNSEHALTVFREGMSSILEKKKQWCVLCPLVLVCVLVHFHFNLVSLVLAPFQID